MCHDERFLNLWVKDLPFTHDYLSDLPRYVGQGHYQSVCDDKSGYDHILLTEESQPLFGLAWQGCYLIYCTLPFGWKASTYIYHSVGLVATSFMRSLGVPCSQYIGTKQIPGNQNSINLDNQEQMGKLSSEFQEKNMLIGFTPAFADF